MDTIALEDISSQVNYPTLSDRVQSTFIDGIFIIIMMFVFALILDRFGESPDWIRIVLFFGIWGLYEPLCTSLGFTIGNYIKGIRVKKAENPSKRINFLQAFVRYILKVLLGWISFLTMHFNPQRRAIHDFASGSVMIRKV
jgi:uncharacterized RDD family membrane protein YckC